MMPSMMDAVSTPFPLVPVRTCITGTMTTRPKKPYTMDGIPASRSMAGFRNRYSFAGQNFAIKIAQSSPIGTPIRIAPAVT